MSESENQEEGSPKERVNQGFLGGCSFVVSFGAVKSEGASQPLFSKAWKPVPFS